MARLVWGDAQRKYEAGVDRGVFYPENSPGVVWNGLISVDESAVGGELNSYYFDGIKYIDLVSSKTYQATLSAFWAPEGFSANLGDLAVVPGFVLTRQRRGRFGLAYRTMVNETDYKIHLVYNAIASFNSRGYSSLTDTVSVNPLVWVIDAVPPLSGTHRPSAHYIFDSTKMDPDALDVLEAILYGTETTPPRMPVLEEILDLLVDWFPLLIVPDSVGGLAELVGGSGDLYRTSTPGLNRALPGTRLYASPTDGLYRME